jgi:hypothetical protein
MALHARASEPRGGRSLASVGHDRFQTLKPTKSEPGVTDWQTNLDALKLPIQTDLVQVIIIEIVELHELSNIVNWSSS